MLWSTIINIQISVSERVSLIFSSINMFLDWLHKKGFLDTQMVCLLIMTSAWVFSMKLITVSTIIFLFASLWLTINIYMNGIRIVRTRIRARCRRLLRLLLQYRHMSD